MEKHQSTFLGNEEIRNNIRKQTEIKIKGAKQGAKA